MPTESSSRLRNAIRDIPDFPKSGILFRDITPVLGDPALFDLSLQALTETIGDLKPDKIVGIDARGFIFGAPLANRLGAGFVPVRKKGKLPWTTIARSYDLEYGSATIEIHSDAIRPGETVWLVDDLLATGGTCAAAKELILAAGGNLVAISTLIELTFLNGRELLGNDVPVHTVIAY